MKKLKIALGLLGLSFILSAASATSVQAANKPAKTNTVTTLESEEEDNTTTQVSQKPKKRALVPTPKLDYSFMFDPQYYAATYPDVFAAFGNDEGLLLNHYLTYGIAEKRRGTEQLPENYITTYTTKYNAKIPRGTNVLLAATSINNKILQPGEVFSYNDTVGRRTREAGYVEAPIFVNGTKSVGLGGGICQVSSTLYAALLYTNIPIVERHQHSLPVDYVPGGMDATVSYGTLDLKFMNPYTFPISIVTVADSGLLTISIVRTE